MSEHTINVLLLEDNADDAELVMEMMRDIREPRLAFTHTKYLRNALASLQQSSFDIALIDLSLPDSEGLQSLVEIGDACPDLPVVVLTGLRDEAVGPAAVEEGAEDYLVKGVATPEHILHAIQFAMARRRKKRPARAPARDGVANTLVLNQFPTGIAGFRLLRTIGEGGSSIVFLAETTHTDGSALRRALKVLRPTGIVDRNRRQLEDRFLQEAQVLAGFDHPNIIRVFDFGRAEVGNWPFMVMELVDGETLRHLIDSHSLHLPREAKLDLVRQMLLALDAIHARGMYHRDVKPDNIMISKTMDAKIIDFGIAKLLDSRLTLPFQVMGTPAYMAPEAFLSAEVDHRADIFSMGVLAYELLVGRRPFGGESIPVLAGQIRTMAPQDPRRFLPNFPPGLQDILARMLRKQPDSRYQSTQEVLEDIDAFTTGAPALRHAHGNGFFGRLFSRDWR